MAETSGVKIKHGGAIEIECSDGKYVIYPQTYSLLRWHERPKKVENSNV